MRLPARRAPRRAEPFSSKYSPLELGPGIENVGDGGRAPAGGLRSRALRPIVAPIHPMRRLRRMLREVSEMESAFVLFAIAGVVAALGIYMMVSGDPRLLHSYHYATTPVGLRPRLARWTGAGLVGTGAACALLGVDDGSGAATIAGAVLLVASIGLVLGAIVRLNGGLITFAPGAVSRVPRPAAYALAGIVGTVVALAVAVPGIHMILTGDVGALHGYHYADVAPEDLPRLAASVGTCMIGLGAGVLVCAVSSVRLSLPPRTRLAWVPMALGAALLLASLAGMLASIVYFNGSLM